MADKMKMGAWLVWYVFITLYASASFARIVAERNATNAR